MRVAVPKRRSPPSPFHNISDKNDGTPRPAQRPKLVDDAVIPTRSRTESEEEEQEQVEGPRKVDATDAPTPMPTRIRPTWATRPDTPPLATINAKTAQTGVETSKTLVGASNGHSAAASTSRQSSIGASTSTDPLDSISRPMSRTPSDEAGLPTRSGEPSAAHDNDSDLDILDEEEDQDLFPVPAGGSSTNNADAAVADGGMEVDVPTSPPLLPTGSLQEATPKQVLEAITDATVGVEDVHLEPKASTASSMQGDTEDVTMADSGPSAGGKLKSTRQAFGETIEIVPMIIKSSRPISFSPEANEPTLDRETESREPESKEERPRYRKQDRLVRRTREEWRQLVEVKGNVTSRVSDRPLPRRAKTGVQIVNGMTVTASYTFGSADEPIEVAPSPPSVLPPPPQETPEEFRAPVRRHFETKTIDAYNRLLPTLTANPSLHRVMFENWISEATARDEPEADDIHVYNDADEDAEAPDMEFEYSNEVLYNHEVPDPEIGTGCGCDGPCDPKSRSCSCIRRQKLYFYDLDVNGFAYDE